MDPDKAKDWAERYLKLYNLTSWSFKFDTAQRRFGRCNYRIRLITLSASLVQQNDEAVVLNIIKHEVAHALCPHHKHDEVWRATFERMGGDGRRLYDSNVVKNSHPYKGICPNCGWTIKRFVAPNPRRQLACTPCCRKYNNGKWDRRFVLDWHNGQPRVNRDQMNALVDNVLGELGL